MQTSALALTKKAIDASLQSNWKEAIELNLAILDIDQTDIGAKIRLGRAYLQTHDFNKAKKLFKEVLQKDPINTVALKNYKLASEKRTEKKTDFKIDPKALLKEPGTSAEINPLMTAKRIDSDDFMPSETLGVKMEKNKVVFLKHKKDEDLPLGEINSDIYKRLKIAKDKGASIWANFVSGTGKTIRILIKTDLPIFRAERQDIKPYVKKGSIDEPELELPELEE